MRQWRPLVLQVGLHEACRFCERISLTYTTFGIGTLEPWEIYRFFMKILHENDVDFQVAPYMAWPQACTYISGLTQPL